MRKTTMTFVQAEPARTSSATRYDLSGRAMLLRRGFSALLHLPATVKGLLDTHGGSARRAQRMWEAEIQRLEELSPHLLTDIGVRQVAAGQYVIEK